MLSARNLLKPADGEPIISPSKDMVLGVYYLTIDDGKVSDARIPNFSDTDEVELAFQLGKYKIHDHIRLSVDTWYDEKNARMATPTRRMVETTIGRVLFNRVLPDSIRFVNEVLDRGGVKDLIAAVYEICGQDETTEIADRIKDIGFEFAMRSGATLAVADITIPPEKQEILAKAQQEVEITNRAFRRGLLTEQERNERIIDVWQQTTKLVADAVRKQMETWRPWQIVVLRRVVLVLSHSWLVCVV
jgi:DNA-directed RNA polymerase subunit beta'